MSKKLFVGGLAWATTDDGLRKAFEVYGEVEEAAVVTDKFSGRSKGFGFVTMADDEGAQKAIDEQNGKELEGRSVTVAEAQPMKPRDNA